jgi:trk system potassium uptake protein TrkA
MRVVIVGASRFGVATARQLIDKRNEVVIVDLDRARLDELADDLDCGLLQGDGSLPTVQREAFGDHADALVLLTNNDDVNIMAALVGRSVGFDRVVPQIVRSELVSVCEELGLDDLITPHATLARSILRMLEDHSDAALELRFRDGLTVRGYSIAAGLEGCAVGRLDLPEGSRVLGLVRGDEREQLAHDDTVLRAGDRLILVAEDAKVAALDRVFTAEAGAEDDAERQSRQSR